MILIYKRECVLTLLWLSVLTSSSALAGNVHYDVRVDPGLTTLDVTARFDEPVRWLSARSRSAPSYLEQIGACDGTRLRQNGRRVYTNTAADCVEYRIDLTAATRNERRNRYLDRHNVLVPASTWLWRPPAEDRDRMTVSFDLPEGMKVSPPWQALDDTGLHYTISPSPENAAAPIAMGHFVEAKRAIPGATLRIAVMKPRGNRAPVKLIDWLQAAATQVSYAYGAFPNPSPHAVIVPVGGSRNSRSSPVPFGRVMRDGGETVEFYVNENAPLERFYDDWTATHEFSHFMLPYVTSRHRWISEGFAQYFQNVLMARAGQYSAERAWQKLYEGFERGRRSRPELSPNAAANGRERGATMKVYWSGAVLALMADLELRRQSDGRQSLDSVLGELMSCCLPADRTWSGTELLAKLDELADADVFVPLYDRYANTTGFPDYTEAFRELGIDIAGGRVTFDDAAPLAAVRAAILEPKDDIRATRYNAR